VKTLANSVFTLGALSFLIGVGLVDYRLSMVLGGALAMLYAWKLSELVSLERARASEDPDDRSAR